MEYVATAFAAVAVVAVIVAAVYAVYKKEWEIRAVGAEESIDSMKERLNGKDRTIAKLEQANRHLLARATRSMSDDELGDFIDGMFDPDKDGDEVHPGRPSVPTEETP